MVKEAIHNFETDWNDPNRRLMVSSGKKAFSALNGQLQKLAGVSITSAQVIRHLSLSEIGDFKEVLGDLDNFAKKA